ncbi:MAG: peptidylprolyl isomerase [Gammaproteobacteria bacterium]
MNVIAVGAGDDAFRVLLQQNRAPQTCDYFRASVEHGALNSAVVFRVLAEKNQRASAAPSIDVVQLGTPQGLNAQRATIAHEDTLKTGLPHQRWTVSAARYAPGELYGSFFVCMRDEPELDVGGTRNEDGLGFAAFGQVVSGFETLEALHAGAESRDVLKHSVTVQHVSIEPATPDECELLLPPLTDSP